MPWWHTISDLKKAKQTKNDEFYTQISDIENELKHYKEHFKWKTVFCNCDDPYESNFFKYFAANFNFLWLKKLIATWYSTSPIAFTQLPLFEIKWLENEKPRAYKIEINEVYDANKDWAVNLADVEYLLKTWKWKNKLTLLKWDWDFRSKESIELLKQADIVVTNPPFSLFREYIAQLMEYNKKFVIIGNMNAITYKEVFPLIKENKIWTWFKHFWGWMNMIFPKNLFNSEKVKKYTIDDNWNYIVNIMWVIWYTNLDITKRHENLILYKNYNEKNYPKYDNYKAIEVSTTASIPCDYDGVMWVPITFLDKYCPEQFEILWLAPERLSENEATLQIKRYINAIQHKDDWTVCSWNKVNDWPVIVHDKIPNKFPYYTSETVPNKYLEVLYARILIRRKK